MVTCMSTSALAWMRASTMARWPADAAACRAVAPPPAATLGSADDSSRYLTAFKHETWHVDHVHLRRNDLPRHPSDSETS